MWKLKSWPAYGFKQVETITWAALNQIKVQHERPM